MVALTRSAQLAVVGHEEMLECMRTVGKALIASGRSVGMVENILADIAACYGMSCDIVALPNLLMIKLGDTGSSGQATVDLTVQRLTYLRLDQVSELMQAIDKVQRGEMRPREAAAAIEGLLKQPHRFGSALILLGFLLSCVGLTLQYQPLPRSLLVTGGTGLLVGVIVLWFQRRPRFGLLVPVLSAVIVSTIIFTLAESGAVYGAATLIIPPLVVFLPGAVLTTGMIELASAHILSGSARLMYGATTLFLRYIGIAAGLSISGLLLGALIVSPRQFGGGESARGPER